MSHVCEVERQETICMNYAEKLHKVDPGNDLLRFYRQPVNGEVWRAIRHEFTTRFGAEGFQGEQCVGTPALAQFYANFAVALRKECIKHRLALD
jgi:hypothetical protein